MKAIESILIAFTSYADYRFYAEILCQLNRQYKCHHAPETASLKQFFSGRGHLPLAAALFEGQFAFPILEDVIGDVKDNTPMPAVPIALIVNEQEFTPASYQVLGIKVRLIKRSDRASDLKWQFAEFLSPSGAPTANPSRPLHI